jgi:hypothetical protein
LDKEIEEIVVGNVANFANNNKNNKTMHYSKNIYIGDSGALCHMVHSNEGMYDTIRPSRRRSQLVTDSISMRSRLGRNNA